MTLKRINRIKSLLDKNGLEALVLNAGPTLTYLTGLKFHKMERPFALLIPRDAPTTLVLPEFELNKTSASIISLDCFTYKEDPNSWLAAFEQACQHAKINNFRIGVESNHLRVLELQYLEHAAPEALFIPADEILGDLRAQKDEEELSTMRKAAEIAQEAMENLLKDIQLGMSERNIAAELVVQLLRAGSDAAIPFSPIVACGSNSADPHATPTDRTIELGDLLLIDWGAAHKGYVSDITRTFAIGDVDSELLIISKIVAEANAASRSSCRPGVTAAEIDRAARDIITAAGYGANFTHRTGHGLGMEGHEPPYIHGANKKAMQPGTTFTIEPGIYLPGRGGIRIEDDVVITSDGVESLTNLPRDLTNII
jgi:Xaa-Pro dipeptidase